jgi:hypothetical protein
MTNVSPRVGETMSKQTTAQTGIEVYVGGEKE